MRGRVVVGAVGEGEGMAADDGGLQGREAQVHRADVVEHDRARQRLSVLHGGGRALGTVGV
ncbi:MAG TPA: hypothetical protein VIG64_08515, partial [Actinomycetota bacterium]